MGFFSEIKKLVFASKSVAKNQAEQGLDYGKEKAMDLAESAKNTASNVGEELIDRTSGLRDAILEKSSDLVDTVKDKTGDLVGDVTDGGYMDKAKDFTESIGEKVLSAGSDLKEKFQSNEMVQKAGEMTGSLSDTVMSAGADLKGKLDSSETVQQAADFTENVGDKVLDTGESFMGKMKEVGGTLDQKAGNVLDSAIEKGGELKEKLDDKIDDLMAKAEAEAKMEAANPKKEFADTIIDTGDSLIGEETNDFFSKASKYADGDYGAMSEGKTKISKMEGTPKLPDPNSKAAGFNDLDGDGDEIIDDAILLDD